MLKLRCSYMQAIFLARVRTMLDMRVICRNEALYKATTSSTTSTSTTSTTPYPPQDSRGRGGGGRRRRPPFRRRRPVQEYYEYDDYDEDFDYYQVT